jgi:hypothetical protein
MSNSSIRLKLLLSILAFFLSLTVSAQVKWYSGVTGDWDDFNIWTQDPSGATYVNPGNYTPTTSPTSASDEVYILTGKTITVQVGNNNKTNALLKVDGRLDLTTTTGHTFTTIKGTGRILLAADNFPSGDATDFITKGQGEGTVIYYGNTYTLTTDRTFYEIEIDLTTGNTITLRANYTLNGGMIIKNGTFRINDNTTTARTLTINGDVTVNTGTYITVGTGNAIHSINLYGNVTNNGSIDLANDAQYTYPATGAAKVYFRGATDNTLYCGGTTDFYRIFLNKGSDETYILSVTSTNTANFSLFGPVNNGSAVEPTDGPGAWERLALVLVNGTLKLGSNINIPILGENRPGTSPNEFHIPSTTCLWVDGADVATHTSGGGWRGITIYGKLRVSAGTFTNPDNTGGITYFANTGVPGTLMIEGGTIYTTQVKQADAGGRFNYIQSGGLLHINHLSDSRASSAVFALPTSDFVFQMSGGTVRIDAINTTATNGIDIRCDATNVEVTGGTFELNLPTLDAATETQFEIYSTAPLYNLTLINSGRGGTQPVMLQRALEVYNLSIGANTTFNTGGFDLSIHGNLTLSNSGTFTHNNNTTYFIGGQNSSIIIGNSATASPLVFNNLIINKDQRADPSTYWNLGINECTGRSTDPANANNTIIQIANDLTITRGQFTIERYTISLLGDISVTDGKLVYNSSLPGRLRLNGTTAQTLTGSALYDPSFGNIELNNANGASITSDILMDNFILTSGLLSLGTYRLTIDTNFVQNGNAVAFSATKMIQTAADHGARGVRFKMDYNYSAGSTTVTFPVGSNGNWAKFDAVIGNIGNVTGYLTVVPVALYHPSRPIGGCDAINGYWKTKSTGLSSITSGVEYRFYNPYANPGGGNEFEYYLIDGVWTSDDAVVYPGTLVFESADIDGFPEEADFSAGKNACFNNTNEIVSAQSGFWDVGSTWVGGAVPATYDYARIVNGHTVTVRRDNTDDAGKVTIEAGGTLDVSTYIGLTYNIVKGGGTFRIASNTIPTAEYDEFMYNDTALFEYYGGAFTLPNFSVYPNLKISGTGNKTMPNLDVLVRKNLYINGRTLLLTDGNDLIVNGSIIFNNAGVLQYPNTANTCIVTVNESIDLSGNSAANVIEVATGGAYTNNHILQVRDNITVTSNSRITLFYNNGDKAADLYFIGDGNSTVNSDGAASNRIALNRLIINKSVSTANINFHEEYTLGGATNGATNAKALYLQTGNLIIDNALVDITLTSGGQNFSIPSTSSLRVDNGIVRTTGAGTGILLDGQIIVGDASQWLLNGAENYIVYGASGNARIDVNAGTLRVGGQIMRAANVTAGVLNFYQNSSSSTVTIGEVGASTSNRGVFEIVNSGSVFSQVANANITIVRQQVTPSVPAIYIVDPGTCSVGTGASFTIGNALTPASQTIGVYSNKDLQNIVVNTTNGPTLRLWIGTLTLNGNLTINTGGTVNANGLDLVIKGNFTNSGTFTANGNTTYFSGGSAQTITGATTFYNLTKNTSANLNLAAGSANLIVSNILDIQSGSLYDNSNEIQVRGNINNNGTTVYGGSNHGIILNGTAEQTITGSGTYGKLTVDNSNNIDVPLGNNITIANALRLDGGILNIGKNLLTLALNAVVEDPTAFSSTNMIQTNVSFTDNGVRKYLPAGSSTFIYPIGAGGRYTPVELDVSGNDNSTGYITVKAANEMHPTIVNDLEAPDPEIVDALNVLQYYWTMKSSGISGFSADVEMNYDGASALVTAPYDLTDYITGRILADGSGLWNKYYNDSTFDETNHLLTFSFAGTDAAGINADYTAGVDGITFKGALPDSVARYETNNSGTWTTGTIWDPNIAGGPRGSIVLINPGHNVTVSSNNLSNYSVEINGSVYVNSTYWHRFGLVSGTGLLYMTRGDIPAGVYDDFFGPAGGTIEFDGAATNYDVLSDQINVNNINFSGTGERRLPNINLLMYGDMTIGNSGTPDVINEHDKAITIYGDLTRTAGTFDAGAGAGAYIEFGGVLTQIIRGGFTGTNQLNILKINNPNGVTMTDDVDINSQMVLTSGVITPGANTLRINLGATISPVSGSSSSFVNGELTKVLTGFDDFTYPIGKNGNFGLIDLIDVTGWGAGSADFSAEYFFSNPTTAIGSAMGAGINTLSHSEYWAIDGPANSESTLKIALDGSSDVANALTSLNDLNILGWDGSQWVEVGGSYTITGNATSGSISCNSAIDYDTYQYFTLGSTETITLITASIISSDVAICSGGSATISFSLTGGTLPWRVQYSDGTTTYTLTGINASPHDTTISSITATTTFTLVSVQDNIPVVGSLVGNTDMVVTVNPSPSATLINNSTGDAVCDGNSVLFTAGTGSNYNFYLNGSSVQNSSSSTYLNSSPANGDDIYVIVTSAQGCSSASPTTTITVVPLPVPTIIGTSVSCAEADEIYNVAATGNTYLWSVTGGTVQSGQGTESVTIHWNLLSPVGTLSSTETVSITETGAAPTSCSGTDSQSVTIYRVPDTGPDYYIPNP